jgi:hypothetical protein
MRLSALISVVLALANPTYAAMKDPGYELVYSYPVETTLAGPDLRLAQAVWPEMTDKAKHTLDVNNSLAPFRLIHPCKLESNVMTSMHKVLGKPIDEQSVAKAVGSALLQYFGKASTAGGTP